MSTIFFPAFSIAFVLLASSLNAQTKFIEFSKVELDGEGKIVLQESAPDGPVPMTKPTRVTLGNEKNEMFGAIAFTPSGTDDGTTISVGTGKVAPYAMLTWNMTKPLWSKQPLRVRYWMIPRKKDKLGGRAGVIFHGKKNPTSEVRDGERYLGTFFTKKGKIETTAPETTPVKYLADQRFEFEWLIDFDLRQVTITVNGEPLLADAPLPDNFLTDRMIASFIIGAKGGDDADAQWDVGGVTVEEMIPAN